MSAPELSPGVPSGPAAGVGAVPAAAGPAAVPTARRGRRSLAARVVEVGAAVVVGLVVLVTLVGPWLAPADPYRVDVTAGLQAPGTGGHLFGTDAEGRDVLSRVLTGGRETVLSTLLVIAVAALVGTAIGLAAASGPRWVDEVLMRICDVFLSVPSLVLALGVAAVLGPSLSSAVIALAVTWWPGYARLVRSVVRDTLQLEYVAAARVLGVSRARLVRRHLLPSIGDTLLVQTTVDVAAVILVISGLSFIGVGAQVPSAEWGAMVADGRSYVVTAWWIVVVPGLAIAVTAVAAQLLGDALRTRLDPTLRNRR
ncbi:ABC transporter permease [Modestobacter versicolor]|uniref:ABC transporter permease n=1 Tax=Modestobacter versicolor TaxID=429133 RepID=UPI0034DECDFB